jgi:hypothetical protein
VPADNYASHLVITAFRDTWFERPLLEPGFMT